MLEGGDSEVDKNGNGSRDMDIEVDEFGLRIKQHRIPMPVEKDAGEERAVEEKTGSNSHSEKGDSESTGSLKSVKLSDGGESSDEDAEFKDARSTPNPPTPMPELQDQPAPNSN